MKDREIYDLDALAEDHLVDASNILVLAPLTPAGTEAYLSLLSRTISADAAMAVVTYTQPPSMWMANWREHRLPVPAALTFIHGGTTLDDSASTDIDSTVSTIQVSPQYPMDIIAGISDVMKRWTGSGRSLTVSVQTITVLLEYVDFDTAFRYLHVLVHRIQSADSTMAFYQMDPNIHDEETINTLSVLFDVVLRLPADEEPNDSWAVISAVREHELEPPPVEDRLEPSTMSRFRSLVNAVTSRIGIGAGKPSGSDRPPADTATQPNDDGETANPTGDALLTDEERIQRLLRQAGGRMNQADIVENTPWSNSSVSRKLSRMEDDGLITRVQVGRGNLVFLDGYEPDATKTTDPTETDR